MRLLAWHLQLFYWVSWDSMRENFDILLARPQPMTKILVKSLHDQGLTRPASQLVVIHLIFRLTLRYRNQHMTCTASYVQLDSQTFAWW